MSAPSCEENLGLNLGESLSAEKPLLCKFSRDGVAF